MSGVGAQGFTHGDHATNQQSRANALEDKMQGLIQQPTLQLPNESEAGKMANFPAKLIPKDPYDNVYAVKANQLNKDTNMYGRTPQITMELTQRDIDYIENKRKVQNKINYEAWLTTAIDLGDPTQVALARDKGVLNDYFEDRLKVIDEYHDLSKKVARMRLLGRHAWTGEDYQVAYAIKSGYLKLPRGSLWDPNAYTVDENEKASLTRGFFNVKRYGLGGSTNHLRRNQDPFPDLPGKPAAPMPSEATGGFFQGLNPTKSAEYVPYQQWKAKAY